MEKKDVKDLFQTCVSDWFFIHYYFSFISFFLFQLLNNKNEYDCPNGQLLLGGSSIYY